VDHSTLLLSLTARRPIQIEVATLNEEIEMPNSQIGSQWFPAKFAGRQRGRAIELR
jgi:hypothetical protein